MTVVRVPASSANLGPAFDAMGMALTLYAELGVVDDGVDETASAPDGAHVVDERHPADVAFRHAGGNGALWVRSPIPMGKGLGFSGAMRVGGLLAAAAQRSTDADALLAARPAVLAMAIELEGHADNVAASLYGGVVATAAGRVVPVRLGFVPAIVVWVPGFATSTQRSRAAMSAKVSLRDAVFNIGRTALLVAALAAGDRDALGWATADRLHQDERFVASPSSRTALANGLEAGAWCGWLSGSGPSVALLCDPADAESLSAAMPADGHTKILAVDDQGATIS